MNSGTNGLMPVIVLLLAGFAGAGFWLYDSARHPVLTDKEKATKAIETCSRRLGDEYLTGFKGVDSAVPLATAEKTSSDIYKVTWTFGQWCIVDFSKSEITDVSWQHK